MKDSGILGLVAHSSYHS